MSIQKKDWFYIDEKSSQQVGPLTIAELDDDYKAGKIHKHTYVFNAQMLRQEGPITHGIAYSMISRLSVEFVPTVEEFFTTRKNKEVTILSGPNNSGKTLLLKQLFSIIGQGGYLINCNRFSHVDILNTSTTDEHEHRRYYDNFIQYFHTSQQNTENNELQLQKIITSLKNPQREKLFKLAKEFLGNEFSLKRIDIDNDFSPFYVDMDGENLRYGSSGTRLLLTLLGTLLDEYFSVILIDEPELGLSPKIQAQLARFLYDSSQKKEFCPHLKQIYIATHSHLFLDRTTFSNNFVVIKISNTISVKPIQSVGDFHRLQFNMLGNELESIFLPSVIILVEGDSDVTFMTKLSQLHVPDRKVAIVRAGGDGGMQSKINVLKEALGEIDTSPYRDRLFVVLDKKHSLKKQRIINQGVQPDNIIVWTKNGIEYYYPVDSVSAAFCCSNDELSGINFENDPIEFNEIRKTKKELAETVAEKMTEKQLLAPELIEFIERIKKSCG